MRDKLPKKKIQIPEHWDAKKDKAMLKRIERVLFFNPAKIYKRLGDKIDPYKRHAGIQMEQMFPKLEGKCACGCGKVPPSGEGWQRKWANEDCNYVANNVLSIINNYFGKPAFFVSFYSGKKCSEEGCNNTSVYDLELDHIVGVKQGGGGCWLSNYRWLCKQCHVAKTNKDFGRKSRKTNTNLNLKLEL